MSRRKLFISTISFLRSNTRFIPNFNFSASESKVVSHSYKCPFLTNYTANFSSDASVSRCWNCNAVALSKPFLACQSCRSVQPVDPCVNYFHIFGLDKVYEIEDANLERKYKDWQKKLHPDLVHTKSEKEKEYAAAQSALVIDAYRTLRTPLLRAVYILRLEGIHVDEEQTVSDPELLAEIMEFREAVDEATDSQALKQIQCQVHEKLERWSRSFADEYKNGNFEEAVASIRRMTYYIRINEAIVKKL